MLWSFSHIERAWSRFVLNPGGGGVLPYITYTGMCRPKGSWVWSSWFRMGYPFQRRFLERGIIFRAHQSSTFVSSHLKLFKDRLLLKVRFNALTSKPLYCCCTLERSIKNWPISRTGYQVYGKFFLERGANLESRATHTHPKNTQVPPGFKPTDFWWFLFLTECDHFWSVNLDTATQ